MQNTFTDSKRLIFIDYWKFLAILSMIIYHFIFDLSFFNILKIDLSSLPIRSIQLFSGFSFILISGFLFSLSTSSGKFPKRRFLTLFSTALLISLATWVYPHESFIKFGIIHLLAAATFLGYFTLSLLPNQKLILSAIIILLGFYFSTLSTNSPFLFPLNLLSPSFSSLDFYPIFPFFGIFLLGQYLASLENFSIFFTFLPKNSLIEKISKNSLLIYLIHQPILIAILFLLIKTL